MNVFKCTSKPRISVEQSRISLKRSFLPLFIYFQITGMDLLTHRSSRAVKFYLGQCPKYLFLLCMLTAFVSQSITIYMSSKKKMECALWLIFLFQSSAHASLYRRRKSIPLIINNLSRVSKLLQCTDYFQYIRKSIIGNIIIIGFYIIFLVSFRLATDMYLLETNCEKSQMCYTMGSTAALIAPVALLLMLTSFVSYYGHVCVILKLLFGNLLKQLQKPDIGKEYKKLLNIYKELIGVMAFVEECMSYAAFATLLAIMGGLFRASYAVMFQPNFHNGKYIFSCITGFSYGYSLFNIIARASEANRYAMIARDAVISLPGVLPEHYKQLKLVIRKEFKGKNFLTFWKIYIIDRSMIINALGTLATYGILIATFGNVQN